jgi:DNA-directed RNA polymerase subunit RPC12/RpoP
MGTTMPISISCPHCSQQLTLNESQSQDTVTCPHCSKLLTAPVVDGSVPTNAEEAVSESLAADRTSPLQSTEAKREPTSARSWLFIVLGVLVAIAVSYFIYDRVQTYSSKKKLERIREEEYQLMIQSRRFGPGDADHKRVVERLRELAEEEEAILKRHPEWRR